MPGQVRGRTERWFQERKSPYPWEQDALDFLRGAMPLHEPFRAWATFSFTATSGRVNECDLLIATPSGLHLVELKGHPGRVRNSFDTWSFTDDDGRVRYLNNPLHLNDQKSKELKDQLERAAKRLKISPKIRLPRVEPAIFLSAPGLRSSLDEVQRVRVYSRDDGAEDLPWIWRDLLGTPPRRDPTVMREASKILPELMQAIGIRAATSHLRFGEDWALERDVLDVGPGWEDRLAKRKGLVAEQGRVRVYLTAMQATKEDEASVQRAAEREYQVLQGIAHPGIAQALDLRQHQAGPAILFRHGADDLTLDAYLQVHGARLSTAVRMDLIRQLAEAVRYAHSRSLYHRALAARSVYVTAKSDGRDPMVRIIDWQSAARDPETTTGPAVRASSLPGRRSGTDAAVYLAPESDQQYPDPVDLDVFGLGALAYLVLTDQPPAARRVELISRLQGEAGLRPSAAVDGISPALDDLVYAATRSDVNERLASAEAFLQQLQEPGEQAASTVTVAESSPDPLTALPGTEVDGDWEILRILGSGATARALLVQRPVEGEDGEVEIEKRVLKVALDEERAGRLRAEARTLAQVGGGSIVRLLENGPLEIGGRTVLALSDAGDTSLGAFLRAEGRLSVNDLERYGRDLFAALDSLAGHGIWHRDLKPENFGILERSNRTKQLVLLDFSLSDVPATDVTVGTRGYIDPFVGDVRRSRYDDQAEWYAAAVTLHEMASGERPIWGDDAGDPRMRPDDELPRIASDLFDPVLREHLTAFFGQALHRDVQRRFESLEAFESAWRAVFTAADAAAPVTTPATVGLEPGGLADIRDAHALAAQLDTPLEAAGLSPRAVSVAQGFEATTVGELLGVPPYWITQARGAGAVIRKELNRRHKQWTARLRPAVVPEQPGSSKRRRKQAGPAETPAPRPAPRSAFGFNEVEIGPPVVLSVDELADLVAAPSGRRGSSRDEIVRLMLGWPFEAAGAADGRERLGPWPVQSVLARALDLSQGAVSRQQQQVARSWATLPFLATVRDEVAEIVMAAGRVMTAPEVAATLRARRGAGDGSPERIAAASLAVVRAAVEAELWIDRQQEAGEIAPDDAEDAEIDGGDDRPSASRLAVIRRGGSRTAGEPHSAGTVLILTESLPGTDDPTPDELATYAVNLGRVADGLAAMDALPGRGVVLRELRALAPPEGLHPLADTRLVELAVSLAGPDVAASPRLEIYPTTLGLERALRISQAASAVPPSGISPEALLARVRARFPALELGPGITWVALDEALRGAGFDLEYDQVTRVFRSRNQGGRWIPSSSTRSVFDPGAGVAGPDASGGLPGRQLAAGIEQGGFLALTLRGRHLPGTAHELAARYPVLPVDLNALVMRELQGLAAENGRAWKVLVDADARFTRAQPIGTGLASFAQVALTRVRALVEAQAAANAENSVLFVHDAGLLARYWHQGGREVLVALQNAARRPREHPFGLWLLCPGNHAGQAPQLDGRVVETIGDGERVVLDDDAIAWLHAGQERIAG